MIKLGIIGYPLGHSLSPVMHKAALDYLGIDGKYSLIETKPEDLIDTIKRLKVEGYKGFNVTIPLKVWITPLLNEVDDYANLMGSVNTVIIKENKDLVGYNTDIIGFINSISDEQRKKLKSRKAAVFGVGGAARAVAVGLAAIGLGEIIFYARDTEKAAKIKDMMNLNFPDIKIRVRQFTDYPDLSHVSIAINTTPIGMKGDYIGISPISKRSVESLPEDAIVYDLVYNPEETRFLQYAKEKNLTTINGIEMLVLQGAEALSVWIDKEPPVNIMREAVLKSLEQNG